MCTLKPTFRQGEPPLGDPPVATIYNIWGRIDTVKGGNFPQYYANSRMRGVLGTVNGLRDGWANGTSTESHFVNRAAVGIGYVSPGYLAVPPPAIVQPTTTPATTTPSPTTVPPPPAPAVMASRYSNRPHAFVLNGSTVSGNLYVFTNLSLNAQLTQVEFWLDDPTGIGAPRRVDTAAPFDLEGGTVYNAVALNTATLLNGAHTVRARATHLDGRKSVSISTFTVSGGVVRAEGMPIHTFPLSLSWLLIVCFSILCSIS